MGKHHHMFCCSCKYFCVAFVFAFYFFLYPKRSRFLHIPFSLFMCVCVVDWWKWKFCSFSMPLHEPKWFSLFRSSALSPEDYIMRRKRKWKPSGSEKKFEFKVPRRPHAQEKFHGDKERISLFFEPKSRPHWSEMMEMCESSHFPHTFLPGAWVTSSCLHQKIRKQLSGEICGVWDFWRGRHV